VDRGWAGAAVIWQASIDGRLESCITASSLTDIYYISRRLVGEQAARETVRKCLDVLTILTVDSETLEQAHALAVADFEDALQISAAQRNGLNALVIQWPPGSDLGKRMTILDNPHRLRSFGVLLISPGYALIGKESAGLNKHFQRSDRPRGPNVSAFGRRVGNGDPRGGRR